MFRVRVLLTSSLGNPREIVTLCEDEATRDKRLAMYRERYPEADIFTEEVREVET